MRSLYIITLIALLLLGCQKQTITPVVINQSQNQTLNVTPQAAIPQHDFSMTLPKLESGIMAFVRSEGQTAVIDSGTKGTAKATNQQLQGLNTTRIGLAIITNNKNYRCFGLPLLALRFDADSVVGNGLLPSSVTEGLSVTGLRDDMEYVVGRTLFRVMVPYDDGKGFSLRAEENSMAVMIIHNNTRILYSSDCEEDCLASLESDLRADVLITPGCEGMVTLSVLNTVKPGLIIFNNNGAREGCPSSQVVDLLDVAGVPSKDTSVEEVVLYSAGGDVYVG